MLFNIILKISEKVIYQRRQKNRRKTEDRRKGQKGTLVKYGYFFLISTLPEKRKIRILHASTERAWNTSLSIFSKWLSDRPRITALLTEDGETLSFRAISAQLIINLLTAK